MFILLKYVMIMIIIVTIWEKNMMDKKAIKILNFFKARH